MMQSPMPIGLFPSTRRNDIMSAAAALWHTGRKNRYSERPIDAQDLLPFSILVGIYVEA